MVQTLLQISEVVNKLGGRPPDIIRSYLILTEILKILADNGLIHYTSYLHLRWKADYKVMVDTLEGVTRKTMIEIIAENYNRSYQAIEKVIYRNIK